MPVTPTSISRRALVTGGLAGTATVLAGCDAVDGLLPDEGTPGVSGAVTPTAPAVDADSGLVDEVVAALDEALALAVATGTAVPALAATGARFDRLHRAHLAELGGSGRAAAPQVSRTRSVATRALLRSEARLQSDLLDAAGRAQSGALAQALASMAAAVAQQRAVAG